MISKRKRSDNTQVRTNAIGWEVKNSKMGLQHKRHRREVEMKWKKINISGDSEINPEMMTLV